MRVARAKASAKTGQKPGVTGRAIARTWRELTGGTGRNRDLERRTLIACSGGADSSGLVIALAAAVSRAREVFVVGHIVHDMRRRAEAIADRDAAKELAERHGLKFVEGEVGVRALGGNAEAAARRLRYAELGRLAAGADCRYVATAHHAEDQFETMLMALVRGSGPRGLSGIAPTRRLGGMRIIRPALGTGRQELRDVCESAGWKWREDATNLDESRLRSAIRARVAPELERIRPGAAVRAGRSAAVLRGAARLVHERAEAVMCGGTDGHGIVWKRGDVRREPAVVLGEVMRCVAEGTGVGRDRLSSRALAQVVRSMRDRCTDPRSFIVGELSIEVTANLVTIRSRDHG